MRDYRSLRKVCVPGFVCLTVWVAGYVCGEFVTSFQKVCR